jgi:hypothetical protein
MESRAVNPALLSKTQLLDHVCSLENSPREAVKLAWHTLCDERLSRRRAKARDASSMRRHIGGVGLRVGLVSPATGRHQELAASALAANEGLAKRWQDLALQERNRLYVFDVQIMTALANAAFAPASRVLTTA